MGGWEREMNGEEGDVERNRTDIYPSVSDYYALPLSLCEGEGERE